MLSPLTQLQSDLFIKRNIKVFVKRDDLIHPFISGNKWRKSHYLLKHIKEQGYDTAVTFGGAYSNHIHAFSYACKSIGLKSIGIIRGEELANKELNQTLSYSKDQGMELIFVDRNEYKQRYDNEYQKMLSKKYNAYVVPEGGTTSFAVDGFKDMLDEIRSETTFDYLMVPCGSGGTISGINFNLRKNEKVIGINVLKGTELELLNVLKSFSDNEQYIINNDYHFGGYAKTTDELNTFIKYFEKTFNIEVEKVYSAKMFFAFFDLVDKGFFDNKTVILNHTGGLQGKN